MVLENREMNVRRNDCAKIASGSESLEKTLDSFGALAAVSIVRRCFPSTLGSNK